MRFTIKLKLALSFAMLIIMAGAMAVLAIFNLSSLNNAITEMVTGPAANLQRSSDLSDAVLKAIGDEKNMILNSNPAQMAAYMKEVKNQQAKVDTILTQFEQEKDPNIRAKLGQFQEKLPAWKEMQDSVLSLAELNTTEGNERASNISMGEGARATAALLDALAQLNAQIDEDLRATDEATNEQYATSRAVLIIALATMLVLSCGVAVWIAMSISSGLRKIKSVADSVAIGDLNQRVEIKTNDEIKDLVDTINVMTSNLRDTANVADQIADGDLTISPKPLSEKDTLGLALERMVERLRGVVGDALSAADNVSAGSQELSSSSEQVSQGATE
ncbi:MCP four helix bundle domain-containing protein, partial [Rhizobium sp. LjRoot30]|uniref:MCP four helix bundle domain-containing protein n=1 Tax=Rhizobium sp. LjRoot30 TaxID=3342320 RepID=UPI003F50B2DC